MYFIFNSVNAGFVAKPLTSGIVANTNKKFWWGHIH